MNSVELLKKLIEFKSLTPNDDGAFDFIAKFMDGFEAIRVDVGGVKNLILTKKSGSGKCLAFAGHIDVVPAGEGWDTDPFIATVKNERIYGRGTADMKSGMSAFLCAMKQAEFSGTLMAILTSDEEGDAFHGTVEALKFLKEKDALPDFCVVAEPTCEDSFGDIIKVGRRGSINGIIKIIGRGGHAAYPEKAINPISALTAVLAQIGDRGLDNGDEYFAPSRLVITDVSGGYGKHNVIPSEARALFNIRNSTATTVESAKAFIEKAIKDTGVQNYELTINQSSNPFIVSKDNQELANIIEDIIEKQCCQKPKRSTGGGTSDARFIAAFGVPVVEFGPQNATIHAPNENVEIGQVLKLEEIFKELITKYLCC
jgi:succinyl-diaminopimelate desuccinylase